MIKAKTVANLTKKVMMITMITRSKVERDAQRTTTLAEISSVSTVTKLTCPIPHFTLIWSKSIPMVLMENWETRQLVVEEEVDQERTHIRDKTLELKISSRPLKEMEVQWTHYAASRKSTISYSRCRTQIPPSLLPLLDQPQLERDWRVPKMMSLSCSIVKMHRVWTEYICTNRFTPIIYTMGTCCF